MSKTPHTIYKGMLLDIYSQHQVNCTCQSGHALSVYDTPQSKGMIDGDTIIVECNEVMQTASPTLLLKS